MRAFMPWHAFLWYLPSHLCICHMGGFLLTIDWYYFEPFFSNTFFGRGVPWLQDMMHMTVIARWMRSVLNDIHSIEFWRNLPFNSYGIVHNHIADETVARHCYESNWCFHDLLFSYITGKLHGELHWSQLTTDEKQRSVTILSKEQQTFNKSNCRVLTH